MYPTKNKAALSGVSALFVLAAIYGLTAVLARYLGHGVGVFEQWYLRYGAAVILALIIFWRRITLTKFLHLSGREWALLLGRAVVGSTIAVALYTLAAQHAKIGTVAFMQEIPSIAIFGVILFHEKLTGPKLVLILLSFLGAAITAVESFHDLSLLNIGAIYSAISGALFALVLVTRRWHSDALNNQEIAIGLMAIGCVVDYVLALFTSHRAFIPLNHFKPAFIFVLLAAGVLSVAINFLANYGFERVDAILAGNILSLEEVFGPIFGYIFYRETLKGHEIIGGLIILLSVICMNQLGRRNRKSTVAFALPD
jgi:drug/metabolite transporter (DMT)-like permease